jgi:putative phosphoribosyl transferase
MRSAAAGESIVIPVDAAHIGADLRVPERAAGLVIFAHGSGSSRFSSRNRAVAEFLETNGFRTLLRDLLRVASCVAIWGFRNVDY